MEIVIFDFDGTLTDTDQENAVFLPNFKSGLAKLLKLDDVEDLWKEGCERVYANPDEFGWEWKGKIAAPAHTDSYIIPACVSNLILDDKELFLEPEERLEKLQAIFHFAYDSVPGIFSPDAKELFETLCDKEIITIVVTNSRTEAVRKKLEKLNPNCLDKIEVYGESKKFMLTESKNDKWDMGSVPEKTTAELLSRPIYLHRGYYMQVLKKIWDDTGAAPEQTLVCGDIYELDLALPQALGTHVHLVSRASTAAYEKQIVDTYEKGSRSDHLKDIINIVIK